MLSKVVRPRLILLCFQLLQGEWPHQSAKGHMASKMGRQCLPKAAEDEPSLNIWALVKDWVGKARQNECH